MKATDSITFLILAALASGGCYHGADPAKGTGDTETDSTGPSPTEDNPTTGPTSTGPSASSETSDSTTNPSSTGMNESSTTTDEEGSTTNPNPEGMPCTESSPPECPHCWSEYDAMNPSNLEFLCHDKCVDTKGSGNSAEVACKDKGACCDPEATCNNQGYCLPPESKQPDPPEEMNFSVSKGLPIADKTLPERPPLPNHSPAGG